MAKIMTFKGTGTSAAPAITARPRWKISVSDNEDVRVHLQYIDGKLLLINLFCTDFDQISTMKATALKALHDHTAALLDGETVTIRPTTVHGNLVHLNNGELMAQYS